MPDFDPDDHDDDEEPTTANGFVTIYNEKPRPASAYDPSCRTIWSTAHQPVTNDEFV